MLGYQAVWFSVFAETTAITSDVLSPDPGVDRFHSWLSIERGVVLGALEVLDSWRQSRSLYPVPRIGYLSAICMFWFIAWCARRKPDRQQWMLLT